MKYNTTHCFACREPNSGRDTVCIVDRICHRDCFKCLICRQELNSRLFCSIMGNVYCEKHHPMTRCSQDADNELNRSMGSLDMDRIPQSDGIQCYCKRLCFVCRLIVDEPQPLRGPGGVYHGGCFRCFVCQKFLDAEQYRVVRRRFYCEPPCNPMTFEKSEHTNGPTKTHNVARTDKTALSKTNLINPCYRCAKELNSPDHYSISDKHYHRECFKCQRCSRVLTMSRSTLVEDLPFCKSSCDDKTIPRPTLPGEESREKTITEHRSSSLLSMRQEKNQNKAERSPKLSRASIARHSCVANAEKVAKIQRKLEEIQNSALEHKNCYTCGKKVYPAEQLNTLNRIYHLKCFQCKICSVCLSNKYQILNGDPYCMLHFKQLSTLKSQSAINLSTVTEMFEKASAVERSSKSESSKAPRMKSMELKKSRQRAPTKGGIDNGPLHDPLCAICSEPIPHGSEVKAKSRNYHRTCFRCQVCQVLLDPENSRMYDGTLHCENHFKMVLNGYAEKPVSGNDTQLNSNTKTSISEGVTNRKKGHTQTETEKIPKCYSCGTKVYQAEQLNILKRVYHRNCFKCTTCQKVLSVSRYGVHDGKPYCTAHHRQITARFPTTVVETSSVKTNLTSEGNEKTLSRTRCYECGKYTNSKNSLMLTDRVYHTDCLKCSKCQKSLGKWNFKEIDGVIFCARHHAEAVLNHLPYIR